MAVVRQVPASERNQLSRLLDERSAGDAMAGYYALHHSADKVAVHAYYPSNSRPSGFLVVARTGLDLFRPLAVPFVAQPSALGALLQAALRPGHPVVLHLPAEQRPWLDGWVDITEARVSELWRLDMREFEPIVNILVTESHTPGGWPRYEIRADQVVHVAAGLNWKGPAFAEVYLELGPEVQGRAFGRSVLAAIAGRLLGESIVALLRVDEADRSAVADARQLGFRPTGLRILAAQALLREHPDAPAGGSKTP